MTEIVDKGKCPICEAEAERHTETNTKEVWFFCDNCGGVSAEITQLEILNNLGVMEQDLSQEPSVFEEELDSLRRERRRRGRV